MNELIDYVPGSLIPGDELNEVLDPQEFEAIRQAFADDFICGSFMASQPTVSTSTDETEASATFIIVTDQINRHGNKHRLHQSKAGKGLIPDDWLGFPSVMFDHGRQQYWPLPVGASWSKLHGPTYLRVSQSKVESKCWFTQSLKVPMDIFRLINAGAMGMASISVDPVKAIPLNRKMQQSHAPTMTGYEITESRMVEWSVCPIGVDAGALRQSFSDRKVGGEKLDPITLRIMEPYVEPKPAQGVGYDFSRVEQKLDMLIEHVGKLILPPSTPLVQSVEPAAETPPVVDSTATAEAPAEPVAPTAPAVVEQSYDPFAGFEAAWNRVAAPIKGEFEQEFNRIDRRIKEATCV